MKLARFRYILEQSYKIEKAKKMFDDDKYDNKNHEDDDDDDDEEDEDNHENGRNMKDKSSTKMIQNN